MRNLTPQEAADRVLLEPPPGLHILYGVLCFLAGVAIVVALVMTQAPAFAAPLVFLGAAGAAVAIVMLPRLARRGRERWIILNGRPLSARVVRFDRLGVAMRGVGNYPILRIHLEVAVPERGTVEASAKRVFYSSDPRDLERLQGREVSVYWHADYPDQAVPTEIFG